MCAFTNSSGDDPARSNLNRAQLVHVDGDRARVAQIHDDPFPVLMPGGQMQQLAFSLADEVEDGKGLETQIRVVFTLSACAGGFEARKPRLQRSLARIRLEESLVPQPSGTRLCPGGAWVLARADAEVVSGRGINV